MKEIKDVFVADVATGDWVPDMQAVWKEVRRPEQMPHGLPSSRIPGGEHRNLQGIESTQGT